VTIPVYVISLKKDAAKVAAIQDQLSPSDGFSLVRIEGVPGRGIPNGACIKLTRDPNSVNNKGALGVFLAHVRAWNHIAESEAPVGIVLEDDVILHEFSRLNVNLFPRDFDIIFINDRVQPTQATSLPSDIVLFEDITKSLGVVESRGKSVGGDGYILSRDSARKIISYVRNDLYFSHVDVRLFAYCFTHAYLDGSGVSGPVSSEVRNILTVVGPNKRLRGYTAFPALVEHNFSVSRRVQEDLHGRSG
jgi:GR25 family glycosyltransferase involved in LPS biosynthesis